MLPKTYVNGFHDEHSVRKMEYMELGNTGLFVSKISIGGGTLSPLYGKLNEIDGINTIQKAIKLGINYIDTAPFYGQGKSEEILGKALKEIPRNAFYIGTKVGRYELDIKKMFDFTAKKTRESVAKSLKLLGLDYVDVIQIHDIEFASNLDIVLNETLPTLQEIVKEGKAKHIGVTGYPLHVLKEAILGAPGQFEVVLSYARNTLIDDTLTKYLDFFKTNNVGIICASGHGMGLLTNAGPQIWHPAQLETKQRCRKAAELCKASTIELGKLAMYNFIQLNGPATFLVGMQSEKLLDCNLDAYFNGLNDEEMKMLQKLKTEIFVEMTNWEGLETATNNKF